MNWVFNKWCERERKWCEMLKLENKHVWKCKGYWKPLDMVSWDKTSTHLQNIHTSSKGQGMKQRVNHMKYPPISDLNSYWEHTYCLIGLCTIYILLLKRELNFIMNCVDGLPGSLIGPNRKTKTIDKH